MCMGYLATKGDSLKLGLKINQWEKSKGYLRETLVNSYCRFDCLVDVLVVQSMVLRSMVNQHIYNPRYSHACSLDLYTLHRLP